MGKRQTLLLPPESQGLQSRTAFKERVFSRSHTWLQTGGHIRAHESSHTHIHTFPVSIHTLPHSLHPPNSRNMTSHPASERLARVWWGGHHSTTCKPRPAPCRKHTHTYIDTHILPDAWQPHNARTTASRKRGLVERRTTTSFQKARACRATWLSGTGVGPLPNRVATRRTYSRHRRARACSHTHTRMLEAHTYTDPEIRGCAP